MSDPWTIPRWWPLTKNRQAIVGFNLEFWFFPELDQWKLSASRNDLGERLLAFGPLRAIVKPVGINREHRQAE